MTDLSFPELIDSIRATANAYHKLTIVVGQTGSGKTRVLSQVASQLELPLVNFGLLLSQRLLTETRRQRALKAQQIAIEVVDEHVRSGVCLDNTEILFDTTLQLNPLVFLQDIARNRLVIASWNGGLAGGDLRFGYIGHPDYFSQHVSGYPVVTVAEDKLQLHLTT